MSARYVGSALVLALLGVALSAIPAHALDIYVDSKAVELKKDECLKRGMAVMNKYFTDAFDDGGAVFGRQGHRLARCANRTHFAVSRFDVANKLREPPRSKK